MSFHRVFAGCLLAAAIPAAASATVTITSISGNPGFETGRITYTPGGIGGAGGPATQDLSIGRIHMTGIDNATSQSVVIDSYCIDIFHWLKTGTFDLQPFTLSDPVKQAEVMKLLGHTAGFIDAAGTATQKKDISAAIQMAVWEIVNESGTGSYSLDTGLFGVANNYGSVNPTARSLAQGYLADMGGWATPTGYNFRMMTAIDPVANQRQVFLVSAPVPEPSAWALLIAGFGFVGGALRARRRVTTAFA